MRAESAKQHIRRVTNFKKKLANMRASVSMRLRVRACACACAYAPGGQALYQPVRPYKIHVPRGLRLRFISDL